MNLALIIIAQSFLMIRGSLTGERQLFTRSVSGSVSALSLRQILIKTFPHDSDLPS